MAFPTFRVAVTTFGNGGMRSTQNSSRRTLRCLPKDSLASLACCIIAYRVVLHFFLLPRPFL